VLEHFGGDAFSRGCGRGGEALELHDKGVGVDVAVKEVAVDFLWVEGGRQLLR
jgi:hypothetical protein